MSAAGEQSPVPNKPKLPANSVVKKDRSRIEKRREQQGRTSDQFSHSLSLSLERKETQLIRWVCVVDVGQCIRKRKEREREREGQWTHNFFFPAVQCTAGPAPTESQPATVHSAFKPGPIGNLYIEEEPVTKLCRYHH